MAGNSIAKKRKICLEMPLEIPEHQANRTDKDIVIA
jgi:hypothetical protein